MSPAKCSSYPAGSMAMASCMRRVASRPARSEPGSWRGEPRRAAPCLAGAVAAKQGATSRCAPTCHLPRYVGSRIRPRVALCCQANVARFSRETAVADARNRRWRPVLLHGTGSVRSAARRLGGSSLGPSAAPSTTQPALPLRVDASVRVRRDSSPSVSPEKLSRGDDRESWSLRLQPARRPCVRRQTGAPRSACASRSHRRRRHPLTMAGRRDTHPEPSSSEPQATSRSWCPNYGQRRCTAAKRASGRSHIGMATP
jgi:hypothetical protein